METKDIRVGQKVTFVRGMFGTWKGEVIRVGHRRNSSQPIITVRYQRRNGTTGHYRVIGASKAHQEGLLALCWHVPDIQQEGC